MRERMVAAFVGLAILVLVMFGAFRAYSIGELVRQGEQRNIERSVELIAALLAEREASGEPVTSGMLTGLVTAGEHLRYVGGDGTEVSAGGGADPDDPASIHSTEAVGEDGSVSLWHSGERIEQRVEEQLLPLVLLAIVMVAVAGLLGYVVAARLSRPFQDLARAASELGRGRFDLDIPRSSIPEAQAVGVAMRESATKLEEMVHRERQFTANASHQLRTPITALRLELEDLSMWPETAGPVADQLGRAVAEVDRLSSTVNDLLDHSRGGRIDALTRINLSALVADAVARWRPQAARNGRTIRYDGRDVIPVRLSPGPILQILDVLIENALKHGSGTVTVDVAQPERYLRISVRDEGGKTLSNDIFARHVQSTSSSGEGIGLAVATEMADAIGGRLALQAGERATFTLLLPKPADRT